MNPTAAKNDIKKWGEILGFQSVGFSSIDLKEDEAHLNNWLAAKHHGTMDYMQKHGEKRSQPNKLIPKTKTVITVRMDYLPPSIQLTEILNCKSKAYIARYALGRDYHKLLRKRLASLIKKMESAWGHQYRAFSDSAPVLERALASQSGQGWIGKNTMLINKQAGSWFFLGEIYTDLELVAPNPVSEQIPTLSKETNLNGIDNVNHCGTCKACLDSCPTNAFVGPYELDANRCISYLTIEYSGVIPMEFRKPMGNRIYGCDDCQIVCPWNRFAKPTQESDFHPRHNLDQIDLTTLFKWSEEEFLKKTEGSPIRRIGYDMWQRNIAIALGNTPKNLDTLQLLKTKLKDSSALVQEHIQWAISQQS